jgi:hypothetical protein
MFEWYILLVTLIHQHSLFHANWKLENEKLKMKTTVKSEVKSG